MLSRWLGITYGQINVWIFVIIWPILTLSLVLLAILRQLRNRQLESGEGRVET